MKKISILMLIAFVFLLSACRTENLIDENISANQSSRFQPTFKKISLNEAKHKSKLLPIIEQVETGLKIKDNLHGKTVNYGNGVSIDTDDVIYIEDGTGFHSYTFNIQHNNAPADAPVENLLLRSLPDGTYKEFLVAYNFTAQEKQIIMSGGYVNTNGKTTVTELAAGTYSGVFAKSSCSYETVTINIPCTSKEHHMPGQKCDMTGNDAPRSFTMVALVCGADTSLGEDGTGGGVSIGNTGGLGSGNPETETPTIPIVSTFSIYVKKLPVDLKALINDASNSEFYDGLKNYYDLNYATDETKQFITWALQLKLNNPNMTWSQFWYNKQSGQPNSGIDLNNNDIGDYDETLYEDFDFENQQTQWPTINNVIPVSDFVGWGAAGIKRNCMDYAKAQIAKKGYRVSNYYDIDSQGNKQTFQIYTEQNGVNSNDLYKGVSYLKYALSHGIPVIVGIDDKIGDSGNLDNSTDHFVVIVGMGTDSKGRFFKFYDNASGDVSQGAHSENKLYIKYPQKIFTGQTQCVVYRAGTEYDYIITMIRKSK